MLRDKTLTEMRDLERDGVKLTFPCGRTWTVTGGRARELWRWYFNWKIDRKAKGQ